MNKKVIIAIPIAGKSKRFQENGFKKHKAFLDINNNFILNKIISTFPREFFRPCVVCTFEQFEEYHFYFVLLLKKYPDLIIQKIKEHNLGPTYSIRKLNIDFSQPLVVHYCDFLVDMDFNKLLNALNKGIFCAPFFRGFHPASFGSTTFCYMKVNPNNLLISLREKSSFTDNRINEPCSTGIYGFPSFGSFVDLADELLSNPSTWGQTESYTSLCMNNAIKKDLIIFCEEVRKFICLGTPRDYLEYLYWEKIYKKYNSKKNKETFYDEHIITAAGKGTRFANEGYIVPKIFLTFDKKPLIKHAYKSIKSKSTKIITLQIYKDKLSEILNQANIKAYFLEETPNGQLNTLYKYLDNQKEIKNFFVSSADYKFDFSDFKFKELLETNNPDVVIFTTSWNDFAFEDTSNYGFVIADENGKITKIMEKPEQKLDSSISNSLLIGTFWFKSSNIIDLILDKNGSNNETFIASSLNNYLKDLKVFKLEVDYWLSLGTPKELQLAEYWFDYLGSQ